jgi:hypothetical protein
MKPEELARGETHRGRMEGAMHDSRRYRDNAAECLLAAQEACELHCPKLHLSMADAWQRDLASAENREITGVLGRGAGLKTIGMGIVTPP